MKLLLWVGFVLASFLLIFLGMVGMTRYGWWMEVPVFLAGYLITHEVLILSDKLEKSQD
jgi:4-hydroxybenzoate polyprenyltransferase